jgi:hypothetical protein
VCVIHTQVIRYTVCTLTIWPHPQKILICQLPAGRGGRWIGVLGAVPGAGGAPQTCCRLPRGGGALPGGMVLLCCPLFGGPCPPSSCLCLSFVLRLWPPGLHFSTVPGLRTEADLGQEFSRHTNYLMSPREKFLVVSGQSRFAERFEKLQHQGFAGVWAAKSWCLILSS